MKKVISLPSSPAALRRFSPSSSHSPSSSSTRSSSAHNKTTSPALRRPSPNSHHHKSFNRKNANNNKKKLSLSIKLAASSDSEWGRTDDEGDDADGNNVAPKAEGELEPGCADVLGTWHFFAPGLLAVTNHLTFSSQIAETLLANSSNSSSNGLFVEATLLRGDNGEPISKCLDGNSIVRFEVRLISTIVSFVSPYNHVHVNTFAQLVLPPTRRKTPGPKACTQPRSRS